MNTSTPATIELDTHPKGNLNSKLLSFLFTLIYSDLNRLYLLSLETKSSHIKYIVRALEKVFIYSSEKNPAPIDIDTDRIDICIEKEKGIILLDQQEELLHECLDKICGVIIEAEKFKEIKEFGKVEKFEHQTLLFCEAFIEIFRATPPELFHNAKGEIFETLILFKEQKMMKKNSVKKSIPELPPIPKVPQDLTVGCL